MFYNVCWSMKIETNFCRRIRKKMKSFPYVFPDMFPVILSLLKILFSCNIFVQLRCEIKTHHTSFCSNLSLKKIRQKLSLYRSFVRFKSICPLTYWEVAWNWGHVEDETSQGKMKVVKTLSLILFSYKKYTSDNAAWSLSRF